MSKMTDKFRKVDVFNSSNFYGNTVYLDVRVKQGYRDVMPSSWQVIKRGEKLSDAWYDYGAKSFSYISRSGKKDAFAEAQSWASERFGINEWKRDPFGSFGSADYVDARIKELMRRAEAQP